MLTSILNSLTERAERAGAAFQAYLKEHAGLLAALGLVAVAAYGFELFQLNLTVDEEFYATYSGPEFAWLIQGRWGMYLLNRFLFPYAVVPFVPLFTALVFHIAALLLLVEAWEVRSPAAQVAVSAVGLTFPTLAYMYTFSTLNFGVGIGLFCSALSLYLFVRLEGRQRPLAVLPAMFAIAIYQGFLPVLAAVFLVRVLAERRVRGREWAAMGGVLAGGFALYYAIQRGIMLAGSVRESSYIEALIDPGFLLESPGLVLRRLGSLVLQVYSGSESIYSTEIAALGLLIVAALATVVIGIGRARRSSAEKILLACLAAALLLLPFGAGLFLRGVMSMRFLVALPVAVAGLVALAAATDLRWLRLLVLLLAGICVFKFTVAANHLFAASHLALEEDRATAARLILRLDEAIAEAGSGERPTYLEVVGFMGRPSTALVPKAETFGASYFEIDQGSSMRIVYFLQTLGVHGLQPLPLERRPQLIEAALGMPDWPARGSVAVVGDTLLVRFGPYSAPQKSQICTLQGQGPSLPEDFCR